MLLAILYSLIPLSASWLATSIFAFRRPKGLSIHIIQALAAGFILAVVSLELIPQMQVGHDATMYWGFVVGFFVMFGAEKLGSYTKKSNTLAFLTGYVIEFFITGLLIGISTLMEHTILFIVAVALSCCSFVCSFSISTRLSKEGVSTPRRLMTLVWVTLCFPLGALVGGILAEHTVKTEVDSLLAFAVAALLWLSTRELITDAYKDKSLLVPTAFFAAFLGIMLV